MEWNWKKDPPPWLQAPPVLAGRLAEVFGAVAAEIAQRENIGDFLESKKLQIIQNIK